LAAVPAGTVATTGSGQMPLLSPKARRIAAYFIERVDDERPSAIAHDRPAAGRDEGIDGGVVAGAAALGAGQGDAGAGVGDQVDGGHVRA
jgi:hypothetical protein